MYLAIVILVIDWNLFDFDEQKTKTLHFDYQSVEVTQFLDSAHIAYKIDQGFKCWNDP